MTIRFTCPGCESVLKIKDEKAGTDAKCPKCKRPFVVPQPAEDDGIEIELPPAAPAPAAAAGAPVELPIDLPVDLPLDLTPEVAQTEDFDPADVLNSGRPAARSVTPSAPAPQAVPPDRRPSIAELMKDFESTKKPTYGLAPISRTATQQPLRQRSAKPTLELPNSGQSPSTSSKIDCSRGSPYSSSSHTAGPGISTVKSTMDLRCLKSAGSSQKAANRWPVFAWSSDRKLLEVKSRCCRPVPSPTRKVAFDCLRSQGSMGHPPVTMSSDCQTQPEFH
jgi:phage FluMu protein Com